MHCIAEVGIGAVTHRRIAERAKVPLGSTTYYFPTLADLVEAALENVAAQGRHDVEEVRTLLRTAPDRAHALRAHVAGYVADRSQAVLEYELYLAAARNDRLRVVARVWLDGLRAVFEELTDPASAEGLAALVDGVLVRALVSGGSGDSPALEEAARRLLGEPAPAEVPREVP